MPMGMLYQNIQGACVLMQVRFVRITYRRGLRRCSFLQDRAMRRPQAVGRVTGTDSHAFLF